jgi:hypothetical protein
MSEGRVRTYASWEKNWISRPKTIAGLAPLKTRFFGKFYEFEWARITSLRGAFPTLLFHGSSNIAIAS